MPQQQSEFLSKKSELI